MELYHSFSLPIHANPNRLDPCVSIDSYAVPLSKTKIGIWKKYPSGHDKENGHTALPLELDGHKKQVNAISFNNCRPRALATACKEYVLMWDLEDFIQSSESLQQGDAVKQIVFFTNPGEISAMCFNNNDTLIAAGSDSSVVLLKCGAKQPLAYLDVHNAMITSVKFCPHYSATLVSISDDRTFCVWDVNDMALLYQSTILCPAPLISLCMNWSCPHMAIGSADGNLRVFDLTDGNDFRQLMSIDVASKVNKHFELQSQQDKVLPSGPTVVTKRGKQAKQETNELNPTAVVHSSESILSIQYTYFAQSVNHLKPSLFVNTNSGAGDMLEDKPPALCIITSNAVLQINSRTYEILSVINLQYPIKSARFGSSLTVGSISYGSLGQTDSEHVMAIVGTLFDRKIHVIDIKLVSENSKNSSAAPEGCEDISDESEGSMTVIANNPLLTSSPLMAEMLPPVLSTATTKGDVATGKKKPPSTMNQPLTFKSKVKSSGYSQAPRTTMFKPETSRSKLLDTGTTSKKVMSSKNTSFGKLLKGEYDMKSGPPSEHCDTFMVDKSPTAIFNLRFSDDGSGLACALSNKSAVALKAPFSKHICTPFIGHNHSINTVYWSNDNSHLLTSSNDKTVSLWDKTGGDSILVLSHQKGSVKESSQIQGGSSLTTSSSVSSKLVNSSSSKSLENKPFSKEVKHAQFFYMDKFILVTHGPELSLYKYYVSSEKDEIKRYQSKHRYKLVSSWQTSSSLFTATAAVNAFFSYLVMNATSGRSLELYDLNKGVLAHTITDCHSRPAHCITVNEGSCFTSQPSDAYNIIATIAPTDPIKLWDLRSKTGIQSLQGHMNKAHACQISFSPCGNYLASGSEDKTAYVYDLRMGTFCERLRGHTEVVRSVAFHPAKPLLATGSLNSNILFFKP